MADTLTLEDLEYEFKLPDTNVDDYLGNLITVYTKFTEVPDKIKDSLTFYNDYYNNLFQLNLEEITEKFNDYYNNNIAILKDELTKSLSLDPDTTYDIRVENAVNADNADKLSGKTYNELITDIVARYITPASVANSLKFNGLTQDEYDNHIVNDLKINLSANSERVYGMDYDTLKSSIITDISNDGGSGGATLSEIQDKVENTWTAYKANDTEKFNGLTQDEYDNHIVNDLKIENAVNADKINGVTYSDLISGINTIIQNNIDSAVSSDNSDLINIIKDTKVTYSNNADVASNAILFDNKSTTDWQNIIVATKVDNAVNADTFNGLTQTQWETKITDAKDDVINQVENSITAYKAQTVEKIGDYDVANYDDHIRDIAAEVASGSTDGSIDADTLQGYTYGDIMTNVIDTKVNNASHADLADKATYLTDGSTDYNINDINSYTDDNIQSLYTGLTDFYDETYGNDFYINFSYNLGGATLNSFTDTDNASSQISFIDINSFLNGFKKQEFIYNDNGSINNINYYTFDDYKFRRDDYNYNDDGSIDTITINLTSNKTDNTGTVVFKQTFIYDDNGNIASIENTLESADEGTTDL